MNNDIKAVIFDYGGVLSLMPPREKFAAMERLCGLESRDFEQLYRYGRKDYDRGTLDGPAFWAALLQSAACRLQGRELEERIRELIDLDARSWAELNRSMITWAERLHEKGFLTAVLSNMPHPVLPLVRSRLEEAHDFSTCVFSCEYGTVKPEERIYRICLERLGVEPETCIFIDDVRENMEAAERMGIHGILFRSIPELQELLAARFTLPAFPGNGGSPFPP